MDLAVFESGQSDAPDAPVVLLVHGWPDSHQLWHGVATRLVDRFRVVSYDVRGHGVSSDPGTVEAYRLEELAADLRAVADAVSPDRPVHVLAHDWGSVEAWEAVCEPGAEKRFASFTSISGPSLDHAALWLRGTLRRPTPRRLAAAAGQLLSSTYIWFFISPLAALVLGRGTPERWGRFLQRLEGFDPDPAHHGPTLMADMVSGLRIYRANVLRLLLRPRQRRTRVPVLQLVATRDVAIRRTALDASRGWVDSLEQRELPHGHWVALSHPDVVARETARFIEAHEPGRPPR